MIVKLIAWLCCNPYEININDTLLLFAQVNSDFKLICNGLLKWRSGRQMPENQGINDIGIENTLSQSHVIIIRLSPNWS